MRGTPRKISLPRRFVADLMHASMCVPFVSLSRPINVRGLIEARAHCTEPAGWAAIFLKAFAILAKGEPTLRTLYAKWPWPSLYELPDSVGTVAIARVEDGQDCVLFQQIRYPDAVPLTQIAAELRHAKDAPLHEVASFRRMLGITRLPLPLRRLCWALGLNFGRQRANFFGSFGITSVAAYGPGELHPLSPGPFVLSYGVVNPDQTIDVVLRWDHRVCDAALMARMLGRLEQVLNNEISAELRAIAPQTDAKPVRAVASRP